MGVIGFTTSGRFYSSYGTGRCLYHERHQRRPDVVNRKLVATLLTSGTRSVAVSYRGPSPSFAAAASAAARSRSFRSRMLRTAFMKSASLIACWACQVMSRLIAA